MNQTDIERIEAQFRRVIDCAYEIVEHAENMDDAGVAPRDSAVMLEKERQTANELAQALADFNEMMLRTKTVDLGLSYLPESGAFDVSYDDETTEVTITYNGSVDLPLSDVTVTKAGSEITPFSAGPLTGGESVTIDVSGLADGESVEVTWSASRDTSDQHAIYDWSEILNDADATAPQCQPNGLMLPEHNLTGTERTYSRSYTIGGAL